MATRKSALDSALIHKYFPDLTANQKAQIDALGALYMDWNTKINVISRKDIDNLYLHHVLYSLAIAKVIYFQPGTSILDVGTGGGFPGIPLAILFPKVQFHLVDSINKKVMVASEVASALSLQNVVTTQARAEDIPTRYQFVISRAVTRLKPFCRWVRNNISEKSKHELANGILYLKGGDLEEELLELNRSYQVFELEEYFDEEFFQTKKLIHIPN